MFELKSGEIITAVALLVILLTLIATGMITERHKGYEQGKSDANVEYQAKLDDSYQRLIRSQSEARKAGDALAALQGKVDSEYTPQITRLEQRVAYLTKPEHNAIRLCDTRTTSTGGGGNPAGNSGPPVVNYASPSPGGPAMPVGQDLQPELVRYGADCERTRKQLMALQEWIPPVLAACRKAF